MAEVSINAVRKTFGELEVIHGVDIAIADGEFVALVGPSGCGKSTLLRMIAGLESITAGTISIGNRIVNNIPPKDRDIAMVFQSYALYPHMKVKDNMTFSLRLKNMDKAEIEKRLTSASEILGLKPFLDRYPRQLSGGQRQRVAMGRAIVREPQVFLFDEPLSNLDAKLRVQMRVEIKELHQRLKTTTVFVTHDQVEAMTMADRIVVMHDGIVEQVGTPLELYDRPDNLFVAGFIGSPAMNMLKGTVRKEKGGLTVALSTGEHLPVPPGANVADRPGSHLRHPARAPRPRRRRDRGGCRGDRTDRFGNGRHLPSWRNRHDRPLSRAARLQAGHASSPEAAPATGTSVRPGKRQTNLTGKYREAQCSREFIRCSMPTCFTRFGPWAMATT